MYAQLLLWERLTTETIPREAFDLWRISVDARHQSQEGRARIEKVLQLAPNFYDGWKTLEWEVCMGPPEFRDMDRCIECSQKLVQLRPGSPDSHEGLGNTLLITGDVDKAREAFLRAEAVDDDHVSLGLADMDMLFGRGEEAVTRYRRIQQRKPFSSAGSVVFLATGRPAEARRLEQEAFDYWLEYVDPWVIPWSYFFENNPLEAINSIAQYYDLHNNAAGKLQKSRGLIMVAAILRELGDDQNSARWLELAESRFGQTKDTLTLRYTMQWFQNRNSAAFAEATEELV